MPDRVVILPYDSLWPLGFEREAALLRGAFDIELRALAGVRIGP